jgi:hypothetical protein
MASTSVPLSTPTVPHQAGGLVASPEEKASLKSPSPASALPRPYNSMSPVAGDVPPPRGGVANWLLVDTFNLTPTCTIESSALNVVVCSDVQTEWLSDLIKETATNYPHWPK